MEKKLFSTEKQGLNQSLALSMASQNYFFKLFPPGHESENSIFLKPIDFNLHAADRQIKFKQLDPLQFSFKFNRIHQTPNNKSLSITKINKS